ncbi:MAG: spore coat associated protein CotJA [Caldicoprobacterales bacterium]|jgi:hypothetical protein
MYYGYQMGSNNHDPDKPNSPVQSNLRLARAYVLPQTYGKVFPPEEALKEGTLFPELVMPYMADKGGRGLQ